MKTSSPNWNSAFRLLLYCLILSILLTPAMTRAQIADMTLKQLRINGLGSMGSAYAESIDESRTGGYIGLEYCTSNNQSLAFNIGFASVAEGEDSAAVFGKGMNELYFEYLFKTAFMQDMSEDVHLAMLFGGEIINIKSDKDYEIKGASFIAGPLLNISVEKFLPFIPVPLTFTNQLKVGVFRGTLNYPVYYTDKINAFYSRVSVDTGFLLPFKPNFKGLILYHGSLIGPQYAESAISLGLSLGLGSE
ncbi:hypothetical protein JXJ21_04315 [candidate division KSB1 bacterium]|nr:hypothetical protein [candidate division KSB1 bacterium]